MGIANKHVILGVTGGIAAYKSADLARRLREQGAEVRVVMTLNAGQFITPLTMQAVSGHPVHSDLLDPEAEAGMGHIELARWADVVLIAPATANFISRFARGIADDLLTTLCLATQAPIALAPAMNQQMWQNPATQDNIAILNNRGVPILGPAVGDQACGETGPGRMLEPVELIEGVSKLFESGALEGCNVMVTAGPTWEAIDPVRGITNHSSGKMGYAVAHAAAEAGARVILVSGPTALQTPPRVDRVSVLSAQQMYDAVMSKISDTDIFISVAAVADYRPRASADEKIKKHADTLSLELIKNPDILSAVAEHKHVYTVGFAAETTNVEQHAREKLISKGVDLIAANKVGAGKGFGTEDNALILVDRTGLKSLPQARKARLARCLIDEISQRRNAKSTSQDTRQARR
ncbi:MAG: bifunctional phosphopantothenoylcysteine decarboxylase/phosphopantothenate--cysteine ligase CoaBC [Arenicellales bacterium]|nr:bifunctional phosphopantothenoylcysteine decarboxylase/phosphopantothenate--cysteine ligase CoaBC [Arenicellales bacterium]